MSKPKTNNTDIHLLSLDNFDVKQLDWDNKPQSNPDVEDLETQERKRYAQDTTYRKLLAKWVMYVVSIWLGGVLVIVILTGAKLLNFAPTVLVTLLATTTINVLGLAFIVLRGLFPYSKFHNRRNK